MNESQHRVRVVFAAALELDTPEERTRYLDEACKDEPELRERVENLLRAHDQAADFLAKDDVKQDGLMEGPGSTIDRYKLLQEIGEGGFGVVFMAEQLEPIRRRVALKIVKPGMDTRQVIARFEAERQALALMDHPNIARVFDAGATESGRPYFVMELVHGVPITQYCDDNGLSPAERLKLFIMVCDAVQHAHQKGIIHRDLKPSNILVTLHDGKPVPKVIDFGTAKALQQPLTEKTMFTAYGKLVGTPQYMSPEQAEMSGLDVDTRADIYSLGVVLYELLTGTTPFEMEQLRAAAYEEMMRMIRHEDPPKPSTRVSTLGERCTDIARSRQVDPDRLRRSLRGDLDWIVMKALEKNRQRRYETANGFALDLKRHLATEPVLARPPSKLYEFQKTVRRHKVGFIAAGSVILALAVGVTVATIAWMRAVDAEQQATEEAERSKQVVKALGDTAYRLRNDIKPQNASEFVYRMALEIQEELYGSESTEAAHAMERLSMQLLRTDKFAEAEEWARKALAIQEREHGRIHPRVSGALHKLAGALYDQGNSEGAERIWREELQIMNELRRMGKSSPSDEFWLFFRLGTMLAQQGRYPEAEPFLSEAVDTLESGWRHADPGWRHANSRMQYVVCALARTLEAQGKYTQAEEVYRQELSRLKELSTSDSPVENLDQSIFYLRFQLAQLQQLQGEEVDMSPLYDEVWRQGDAGLLNEMAWDLATCGEPKLRDGLTAVKLADKAAGEEPRTDADIVDTLAAAYAEAGDFPNAVGVEQEAITLLKEEDIRILHGFQARLHLYESGRAYHETGWLVYKAQALLEEGSYAEAEPVAREYLALCEVLMPDRWATFNAKSMLGEALRGQNHFSEAEPLLIAGYQGLKAHEDILPPAVSYLLPAAAEHLVQLYDAWDKPDQAGEWSWTLQQLRAEAAAEQESNVPRNE